MAVDFDDIRSTIMEALESTLSDSLTDEVVAQLIENVFSDVQDETDVADANGYEVGTPGDEDEQHADACREAFLAGVNAARDELRSLWDAANNL